MHAANTRDTMIESNLGLVRTVAKAYTGRGVPLDDLVQEGTIGLMQAVDRFDPERGVKFSTYAVWWIRRAVIDALGQAQVIRVPDRAQRSMRAVEQTETELRANATAAPTPEQLARHTGLSAKRVRTLQGAARVTSSLDAPVGEDGTTLAELVADPDAVEPSRHLDELETRRRVWRGLRLLPARHRDVLVRRFGVVDGEGQTHAQIAAALGMSDSRSLQLEQEALRRLRELERRPEIAA